MRETKQKQEKIRLTKKMKDELNVDYNEVSDLLMLEGYVIADRKIIEEWHYFRMNIDKLYPEVSDWDGGKDRYDL